MRKSPFKKIGLDRPDLHAALTSAVAGTRRVRFCIKWLPEGPVMLTALEFSTKADTWQPVIEHPILESDGDITVDIDDFEAGQPIKIRFTIVAMQEIAKAATLIVEDAPPRVTSCAPKTPGETRPLKRGEHWADGCDYVVGGSGL